ncbi:hypothetical protein BD309DRAFT_866302 [Dichomitus squalens]|uniref:UvrD-like helicase C-terminal domain-containing protein n=1 Tax=Dichomitus squalens TaxID=114155 RepID=A0A4Q9PGD9_9APHY|nr:hypothetical protein BD309DRAFT_866302 [Dichomitus squalens]TBU53445.1 hypothetical protein BD310DRAFT_830117 [Dichomitus squalens]
MSHSTTADMISDVHDIENALYNSFSDLESVIGRLMGSHGRAESALATLNDATFSTFTREIYARFPKTARQFVGSLSSFLLSSLATALTDVSQQGKLGKSRDSNECWKAVVLARPALAEIASLSDNSRWSQADIRVKPFVDLGVDPPSNPQELFALETQILRDQEGILKHIFSLLRGPARDDIIARWHALAEMETVVDSARPESSGSDETATPEAQPESQTPINAHPALDVLPLKAAFYEDHVKGFGEWEVFITDNANSDFRKLRKKSPELLRVVMKKIRDLSRGHFSPDNQILISDTENSVPIFKAKMTGVSRLVYQVDCVKDLVSDAYIALRIFGVYNHAELKHKGNFWVELSRDLGRKGKEYRDRCRARSQPTRTARDVFSPVKFWLQSEEANKGEDEPLPLASLKDVDYSEVLSMHRSVTLSKGLFNSFLVDRDIRFMFRPSTKEIEIIEHPHSCYVIGRSGTGKTLSMMYKIVSRERGWASISAELPKPRQLFVTRSRMLAAEVQRTVDHLLESFKLADLTQQELLDIWRRQVDPMDEIRPLPRKWSDLDDEHFPMCISFDQLRDMLEADFAACDPSMATTIGELGEDIDFEEHAASFVSWKRFATAYWDHLPQHLTRGLVSVFGEIMGVLKGSEGTIDTPHGNLDREAYLGLSPRHSTFVSIRNQIYDILQRYNLLKRRRHEYDDADRLINAHTLPGRPVNFLFNDEAQDNLIIDMLRIIVRDDASRKRLFKALFSQGVQVGLVMTVYESKGLEFDDVFIWHFFDSTDPSEREWSVICDLFLGRLTRSLHRSVDEYRHLKSLYVAITRARNRLFIIEESSKGDPMLAVWQKLGLVDVNEDNQPISLSMKTPEPEEWAKRGRSLMDKQNYEQAKYCFEQAGFRREGDIAQAYLDQEAAVTVEQFRKAAQSFKSCADLCFGVAEHEQLLIASAICYSRAGAFAESAALYYTARAYTRCAQQYIKASMMDEARQVILRHRNEINAYVLRKVCVHFLDSGEQEKAAELFPDLDTFSEFIRSHNLIGHLATYLESLGLLEKAAEVRLELNQVDKAIALFLRDESHGSVARGTNRLLDELWRLRTMGQPENKYSNVPDVLIDLVSYRKSLTGLRYRDYERDNNETHMFSSIISRQAADLMQTGVKLFSVGNQTNAALLSLDYAFAFLLEDASLEPSVLVDSPEFFPAFCTYATLLKSHHPYGTLDANDDAIWRERTYWMYALSSSLHIPFFSLGTPSMFHRSLVPEFSDAARVIRSWIIDILYFAFTPASTHWISTGALRIDLIPCAALLGYILDKLEDHPRSPQSRVVPIPLELWYGKLYSQHLQQLGDYASRNEPSHFQMPGALLYLQFLLEGGGGSFGREAVISYITEGLSTAIVLANRGRKDKPLHNVILVRRWVINLADLWSSAKPPTHHHNEHVQKFIKLFPALLGSLCAVPDGASIRRVLRPLSNDILSYVSSVVKALTLVGHWLKHTEEERLEMVGYVTNIPVHYRPPHLRRLSAGSRWTHLREAIWWQSPPALPRMDQLVHIQNSSLADTDPMRTPGFVVRVAYDRLGNLESQLTVPQPTRQAAPFPATWFLPRRHPLDGEKVVVPSHIAPCLLGHLWPQEV